MNRISYEINEEGLLISNLFLIMDNMCFAIINPQTFEYEIRFIKDSYEVGVLSKGQEQSLDNTKKKVRTDLIELGVKFHDEVRNNFRA